MAYDVKSITRTLVCIISHMDDKRIDDFFLNLKTEVLENKLREANDLLKDNLNCSYLPDMHIDEILIKNEQEELDDIKSDQIRFVVHSASKKIDGSRLCAHNSFVVEAIIDTAGVWKQSTFDLTYRSSDKCIYDMIVDAMLDIQLFYYHSMDKKFKTLQERKTFSKLKAEFCRNLNEIYYTKSHTHFNKYCSIAFFCRNENGVLDISKYVQLWKQLVGECNHSSSEIVDMDTPRNTRIANMIIKKHKYGAQLSYKKLKFLLQPCNSGEMYELVRICRKPKSKYLKKRFRALFGKKSVKIGMIKIVPQRQKYQYLRYKKHINVFEFECL